MRLTLILSLILLALLVAVGVYGAHLTRYMDRYFRKGRHREGNRDDRRPSASELAYLRNYRIWHKEYSFA